MVKSRAMLSPEKEHRRDCCAVVNGDKNDQTTRIAYRSNAAQCAA